jgi:hypothetical protein
VNVDSLNVWLKEDLHYLRNTDIFLDFGVPMKFEVSKRKKEREEREERKKERRNLITVLVFFSSTEQSMYKNIQFAVVWIGTDNERHHETTATTDD